MCPRDTPKSSKFKIKSYVSRETTRLTDRYSLGKSVFASQVLKQGCQSIFLNEGLLKIGHGHFGHGHSSSCLCPLEVDKKVKSWQGFVIRMMARGTQVQ